MRYKAKNFKASRLLHKYTIENEMKVYIIMFFTMMQGSAMTYARFRMQVLSIVKILDTASALVIILVTLCH